MTIDPTTLQGRYVRLEPITTEHRTGLCAAVGDGELWKLFVTMVPHPEQVDSYIRTASEIREAGSGLAYATVDTSTGEVAGSTRFMNFSMPNRRIEIGYTFVGAKWQRTRINTEAKLLMLAHAFDSLSVNRVEFLTDYLNFKSRAAILRLGAKEEGVLRNHMLMADGRVRDSVIYSIIKNEWPGVRQHLKDKLA